MCELAGIKLMFGWAGMGANIEHAWIAGSLFAARRPLLP